MKTCPLYHFAPDLYSIKSTLSADSLELGTLILHSRAPENRVILSPALIPEPEIRATPDVDNDPSIFDLCILLIKYINYYQCLIFLDMVTPIELSKLLLAGFLAFLFITEESPLALFNKSQNLFESS